MGNYKILKPFFKNSNRQNYYIDDVIELSKEDAKDMVSEGYLEETKAKETTHKEKAIVKEEVVGFKVSTKATGSEIEKLPKATK